MMIPAFARALSKRCRLKPQDSVLAAVSGGGDSVALLRLLVSCAESAGVTVTVAHINHGLRGSQSDEDERFVEDLVRRFDIPYVSLRKEAPGTGLSEETLRKMRHSFLLRAAEENGCSHIALGHTMDDQAETILMRMLRGSGRRGLSGMSFNGPGRLIRPMLGLRRDEVRKYLEDIGQPWREDETNGDPRFLRNRIRSGLLPHLEGLNPSIIPVLGRAAEVLTEEDLYLEHLAHERLDGSLGRREEDGGVEVPAGVLVSMPTPLARRAARRLLAEAGGEPRGASFSTVERLLDIAGRGVQTTSEGEMLGGGMRGALRGLILYVWRDPGQTSRISPGYRQEMTVPGSVRLARGIIHAQVLDHAKVGEIPAGPDRVALDADLLGNKITIRTRVPGDTFHPFGAPGRRKLKNFLIDRKVPRYLRDGIPLVEGPKGIAWVVGERIAHQYRLTGQTRRVAVLEYRTPVDPADS